MAIGTFKYASQGEDEVKKQFVSFFPHIVMNSADDGEYNKMENFGVSKVECHF